MTLSSGATAPLNLNARPATTPLTGRIDAIDLARGVAVGLMILSHGIKGLLDFDQFAPWGIVPLHLITKFSSSLFILVFGIALGAAFLPRVGTADWPRYRLKLFLTGFKVLFWYKVLTVVELFATVDPSLIVGALLYELFPSFVEVLGFYAIALLWVPFFLSLWAQMPLWLRLLSPVLMVVAAESLRAWNGIHSLPLKAILIEDEGVYTWGQLTRGPLVLVGLLIGEGLRVSQENWRLRLRLIATLGGVSVVCALVFVALAWPNFQRTFYNLAYNVGKHPPQATFMAFSLAGAFAILALSLFGGRALALLLRPVSIIGSNSLQAFIFHIVVIFVGFRFLLGLDDTISYGQALTLTLGLIVATALWIKLIDLFRRYS
ncbi:heparan-alpha-glucosaminide N-acetyltransferase domain-containing protein [Saccharospirillum mangrovi]|uniref:heparan-alpha-glucosaminide N-acetyltransferase domain-containing protein n=1 Tax=Saccharospirillum mangrovi TaxID=2161747 RepID=UPI001E48A47A|nr:heparan-alpha-glucosaminide N-acetyltransferase domain-containing protein [Saccharospirillum mangrovi]